MKIIEYDDGKEDDNDNGNDDDERCGDNDAMTVVMTATVVCPEADQVTKPSPATDLGKILACAIISKTLVLPAL